MTDPGPIFTVMDAHCALCARGAAWIARNDTANVFKIVPMQGELGRSLLMRNGLDPDDPASWLFVENGATYSSLDALIRVGWRLGGIGKALIVFRLLPRVLQDKLYNAVARRRYLAGRTDLCALPDPDVKRRLVL
ncbi:MAG: DCC1-like thiol-disulfide oxidoreductase family protein [Pseudomonadota bacterium]